MDGGEFKKGQIVWVELPDPQDANPKSRPAVVLDKDKEEKYLLLVASTGSFDPDKLGPDEVKLPSGNRDQPSCLGLNKPTVVKCSWAACVDAIHLSDPRGPISNELFLLIAKKVSDANSSKTLTVVRDDRQP